MFIPLHDGVALRYLERPTATYVLIALNVVIYLLGLSGLFGNIARVDLALGVVPAVIFGDARLAEGLALVPAPLTLATSMFLHGSVWHLAGNMLFLWVFGDNVEDSMGSRKFVVFYFACGIIASLVYATMARHSEAPLIGASGAVSGIVVAYLMLHPRVMVFGLIFSWLPLRIAAIYVIGLWLLVQIGSAIFGSDPEIGWWAHVGGILAGAALIPLMKRKGVGLFGRTVA